MPPKGNGNGSSADSLPELKIKRGQIKDKVTRLCKYFATTKEKPSSDNLTMQLKARLEAFQPCFSEFDQVQIKIERLDNSETELEEREQFESSYFDILIDIQTYIQGHPINSPTTSSNPQTNSQVNSNNPGSSPSASSNIQVKLPTIDLPRFSGDYTEWMTFSDTFNALIDQNTGLTPIQKLTYLKSALTDDASRVIDNLKITADNYSEALKLLKGRFENKRIIAQEHIKSIFNLPQVVKGSETLILRQLADSTSSHLTSLKSLGRPTENWDDLIIYLINTKFDYSTKREWEIFTEINQFPVLDDMYKFLNKRAQLLQSLEQNKTKFNKTFNATSNNATKNINNRISTHVSASKQMVCSICHQPHSVFQCQNFLNIPVEERAAEIKKLKLCLNCLKPNHTSNICKSSSCKKCNKRHHTLLHAEKQIVNQTNQTDTDVKNAFATSCTQSTNHQILLSTALICVEDKRGNLYQTRALLDSGSMSNFITDNLCKKLGIPLENTNISVSGINKLTSTVKRVANINISSRVNEFKTTLSCLVIPKITENLPPVSIQPNKLLIPDNICLADPSFNQSGKIDILLGAEIFWELLIAGQIHLGNKQPILQNTQLGYIVGGPMSSWNLPSAQTSCHLSVQPSDALNIQLSKFWITEEVSNKTHYSLEENLCEKHFKDTHKRDTDGRFITKLPFKEIIPNLGSSKKGAIACFKSLERKFKKEPQLKTEYTKFMHEYISLGHMLPVNVDERQLNLCYYLPHHSVLKQSSLTTRLRVVFNGSYKTTNGLSLNDNLLVGPTIQPDLFTIAIQFRNFQYVINADITKMYRQIWIAPEDRQYQLIIWRDESNKPLQTYELQTVTYGTASAPFTAVRCIKQLAIENEAKYPHATNSILNNMYMDDLLTGGNSIEETIQLRHEITDILQQGGFNLRKWASNSDKILPETNQVSDAAIVRLDSNMDNKTLGLVWNPSEDTLKYEISNKKQSDVVTKRTILSSISQIFDPLGLIGPIIIVAKILIQEPWVLKLEWDQEVPHDIQTKWKLFTEQLTYLGSVRIPRKVIPSSSVIRIEIHAFCDASLKAYGSSIYIRTISEDGNISSNLLTAKSRLAPLKTISLAKLELCGAVLLTSLLSKVLTALRSISVNEIFCWTDSTIVLAWLAAEPCKWKVFVANRVSEIQSVTHITNWHHVKSEDNPSDIITRGLLPQQLIDSSKSELWFHGPNWLKIKQEQWPNFKSNIPSKDEIPEQKINLVVSLKVSEEPEFDLIHKFSSFSKVVRITAYCLRFIRNCRSKCNKQFGNLSTQELQNSKITLIKLVQAKAFPRDIANLKHCNQVQRNSPLLSLSPFLDESGVIRVGGRLKNSKLSFDSKHPILLPKGHHLVKLIIIQEHTANLHSGPQATLMAVRQHFWPISGKNSVKQVLRKCVTCFRTKPVALEQLMGDLPKFRVQPARPFLHCSIDYAGPLNIKLGGKRSNKVTKCYIALFICMATRAVHLEIVSDCTTNAFLNSLKRIIARRGYISHIWSDNAKTFVGAYRELQKLFQGNSLKIIHDWLANKNITWHFIPPRSPNFGGFHEAAIKSAKYHLKRVAANVMLTFEEMYTLITQIEACLNSRPLSPISNNPDDLNPLTPGHFLIGGPLTTIPEDDLTSVPINRLSRWQHIQQIVRHFWKRWSNEYLGQLQQRKRWQTPKPNEPKPGTVVILKEDNLPPLMWKMGRIVETHPGADGRVRVVSVRTRSGVVKRAISKVCVLPVDE